MHFDPYIMKNCCPLLIDTKPWRPCTSLWYFVWTFKYTIETAGLQQMMRRVLILVHLMKVMRHLVKGNKSSKKGAWLSHALLSSVSSFVLRISARFKLLTHLLWRSDICHAINFRAIYIVSLIIRHFSTTQLFSYYYCCCTIETKAKWA